MKIGHFVPIELPVVAMFVNGSRLNEQYLYRFYQGCFLPNFDSFAQAISEKIFRDQPIRNKNGLWWSCLLADRDEMTNLHSGPARCFLTSFSSLPLGQMNQNLVGTILGMSSINVANFVPIR
jgi:hypothetical protein